MKKRLGILFILFILTGCTANYNLNIEGNTITENISGTVSKSEYEIKSSDTSENEIYSDYINRIKSDVIIAKIKSVDIKKDDEKTNIKTSLSFELPIFNIRKSDNINITMYDKDNRMFIVRAKVAMDTVNIAG